MMRRDAPQDAGAMDSMTTTTVDRDLAAIRARGRISLEVEAVSGLTRRRRGHESGALRGRFPGSPSGELEGVTGNTGGGMTGGGAVGLHGPGREEGPGGRSPPRAPEI